MTGTIPLDSSILTTGKLPARRRFKNSRMPLAYTDWGRHDAPLLILIHGSRDHSRSWDDVARILHRSHHVVAVDLRGHGDSGWAQDGRYDFAAYLSDLAALCETLMVSSAAPVIIIGHSLGAHIALRYAGIYPDRVTKAIAIEAVGAPPELEARRSSSPVNRRMREWLEERQAASLAHSRKFPSVSEAVERMRARHGFLTPAQARHLTRLGLRRASGAWQWKHDPYLAVWPFPDIGADDAEGVWRQITCPTLLIRGQLSWLSDMPAKLLDCIPQAQEVLLPQSGHWPHHDALEACLSAIETFLGHGGER